MTVTVESSSRRQTKIKQLNSSSRQREAKRMSPPRLAPLPIGRWRSHIPWPRRLLSSREARPPMLPRHMGAHPWRTPLVRSGHGGRAVRYQVSCHQLRLAHRHSPGHFATCTPYLLGVGAKARGRDRKAGALRFDHRPRPCHTYQSPVTSRCPAPAALDPTTAGRQGCWGAN